MTTVTFFVERERRDGHIKRDIMLMNTVWHVRRRGLLLTTFSSPLLLLLSFYIIHKYIFVCVPAKIPVKRTTLVQLFHLWESSIKTH